jgi:phosphoglycolate phosphatase
VLIDLDGTLLDTAADLAAAANAMLAKLGREPRTLDQVKTFVGKGIARLVERCLTGDLERRIDDPTLDRALDIFRVEYGKSNGTLSSLYPGAVEGLEAMAKRGLKLACVTNKAARFTTPLLERHGLAKYFETIITGDMVQLGKPHPECYFLACDRLGLAPSEAVVIGDSDNDARAARAAGIRVLCVSYGYNEGRPAQSIDCDGIIDSLSAFNDTNVALGGAA